MNAIKGSIVVDIGVLLYLSAEDVILLGLAEPSYKFWDNPDDSIYDSL